MNILTVDDNQIVLNSLVEAIKIVKPYDNIYSFTHPIEAIGFLEENCKELYAAFLDIELNGISGIEFAIELKQLYPNVYIIFVTAYSKYAVRAFELHANGYILKPITLEKIEAEFDAIQKKKKYTSNPKKRIEVCTFGNFEIFADGKPIHFSRTKSKELLAFLIDRRGASCTMSEISGILFEDTDNEKRQKQYIRTAIMELKKSLTAVNAQDILNKEHNSISVDITKFDCDYYRLLEGDAAAINSFMGEYMTNYSWSEFTVATLCDRT